MEKKEYKKPTLEVILTEMGPVLAVISPGQDGERPAPPFTGGFGGFDGSDEDDDKGRNGYQGDGDDDQLE